MAPAVLAPPLDLNQQLKVYCSTAEFILISRYPVHSTHPLGVPLVTRASPSLSALLDSDLGPVFRIWSGPTKTWLRGYADPRQAPQQIIGREGRRTGMGLAGWSGLEF